MEEAAQTVSNVAMECVKARSASVSRLEVFATSMLTVMQVSSARSRAPGPGSTLAQSCELPIRFALRMPNARRAHTVGTPVKTRSRKTT